MQSLKEYIKSIIFIHCEEYEQVSDGSARAFPDSLLA